MKMHKWKNIRRGSPERYERNRQEALKELIDINLKEAGMKRAEEMIADIKATENAEVRMRKALSYISNITTMAGEWNAETVTKRMELIRSLSDAAQVQ